MSGGAEQGTRHVRVLTLKLITYLLLAGSVVAVMLVVTARFAFFSRLGRDGHSLTAMAGLSALLSGIALLIGVATCAFVVRTASREERQPFQTLGTPNVDPIQRRRRSLAILAVGMLVLAGVAGVRWSRADTANLSSVHAAETGRP